jgi:O-antigen/teichoic acid export membrane protein
MRRIVSAVSKISFASGANIFSGIIRIKIFAILLGTLGVGIVSQLTNFSGLMLLIITLGIPIGITKYISEFEKDNRWNDIYSTLNNIITILLLVSLICFMFTVIFSKEISYFILDTDIYSLPIILVAAAFPFTAIMILIEAYIKGIKKFNQYVKISVINSILTLIVTIIFVYYYSVIGFAISVLVSSIITVFVYFIITHKHGLIDIKRIKLSFFKVSGTVKDIFKIGAAALTLGVLDQLTMLVIRSLIIKFLGTDSNGIYQCVNGISNNYFSIFYLSISAYILPILSEAKDNVEVNKEINNAYKLTLLLIIPITTLTFVFREYIILLLYSPKFLEAGDLMLYNFIGDYFKALSWVLGAWLIPLSKIRLWLILGVIYYINYFSIFMILNFISQDIYNVVIAYCITAFIHFVLNLYFIRKYNNFKYRLDTFKIMIISTGFIFVIFALSEYKLEYGYYTIAPLIMIWAAFSIHKNEFHKLLSLLKLKS